MDDTKKMLDTIAARVGMSQMELQTLYDAAKEDGFLAIAGLKWLASEGIPVFLGISKITGESVSHIENSTRKIEFKYFDQILRSMTQPGGVFGEEKSNDRYFIVFYMCFKFIQNQPTTTPFDFIVKSETGSYISKNIVTAALARKHKVSFDQIKITNVQEVNEADANEWIK